MIKGFIGLIILFALSIGMWSEMSNFISPLISNTSESDIDAEFKQNKKMVKKEPISYFSSLSGNDSNKNGLRDDPERLMLYQYENYSYTMIKGKKNEYYLKNIKHLLKKMQDLTKYEKISKFKTNYESNINKKDRLNYELKYKYYSEYFSILEYTKCLYKKIDKEERVGSGNAFLHVIRKQLNTKKRRDFFGDHLLEQNLTIFDGKTFSKPKDNSIMYREYTFLHDFLKKKDYKYENIKKCEIWEYK